jgi:hypothetical protein
MFLFLFTMLNQWHNANPLQVQDFLSPTFHPVFVGFNVQILNIFLIIIRTSCFKFESHK